MKRKFLFFIFGLSICIFNALNGAISGDTPVEINTTHSYTTSVNYSPPYMYTWTVTKGTINGSASGFNLKTISVTWTSQGNASIELRIINTSNGSTVYIETYSVQVGIPIITFSYDNTGNREERSTTLRLLSAGNSSDDSYREYFDEMGDYQVKIFPNPVKSNLSVKVEGMKEGDEVKYTLYDQNGRLLHTNLTNSSNFSVEMNEIPAGIYFLNLSVATNTKQYKIIKE